MTTLMDPQGLVQDNEKTWNEEICHILYHEKFAFCLLCKKDIREPRAVLPHLMGNDHRQHKNKLFSNCILDPFCDSSDYRFSEIVNNSKSDIAQLLHDADKPCYVYQIDATLVCLICQETISSAYDIDQMKNDLISHFSEKNESHFKKYRERISWVYYLNKSNNAFIFFHKLLVYCSVCDKILEYDDNLMLYAAAGHLQTSQHKNNVGQVGEYNFVESSSQSGHSTDDNCLNADVSTHKPVSEVNKADNLICPDCGEPVEIINENSEFSMELHSQKHKNLSLVNAIAVSEYKENNEYPCPLCYEDITIYNKDVEISITRHFEEKHPNQKYQSGNANKEPDSFNFVSVLPKELASHGIYFDIYGNDVMCKLCSYALEYSSNDSKTTEQAIIDHILKSYHMDQHKLLANKIMTNAVVSYNSKNRPRDPSDYITLFSKLVSKNSIVNKNKEYIQNNKTSYVCTLCQRSIAYSSNENSQLLNFLNHFNGERHTKRSRALIIDNKTPDNYNTHNKCDRSACSKSSAMRKSVENKVSDLSEDVHNTVKYLDVETNKLSDNVNVKKVSDDPCISPHMKYFKVDNSCFHCILCNVNINVSTKKIGEMLKDHISGSKHTKKYKQLLAHEVLLVNKNTGSSEKFNEQNQLLPHGSEEDTDQKAENLADNHNINNIKVDNEKVHYDVWLSKLVSKNSIVSINKEFIQKNERSYVCTLCQKRIPYCSKENSQLVNFLTHFYGGIHTKSFHTITHGKNADSFKLNKCDGSSKTSSTGKCVENKVSDFSEDVNSYIKSQEVDAYKLSDNVYFKKAAEDTCISPHMTYFKVDDCCFHCILCNVNIIVTAKKIKMLKDHILGSKHTKKHKLEQLKLAHEDLFVDKNTDSSEKCKEQHQLLLHGAEEHTDHTAENLADYQVKAQKLSDNVYNIKKITEDQCIYPHMKFSEVENSCFHCVLCNANIKAKSTEQMGKLIKEHVLGQKHTKKYKLEQLKLAHEESSVNINTYPSEKFVEQHQKQPHGRAEDTDQAADNFKGNPYVTSYIKVENDKIFTCILCNVAIMDSGGKRLEHVIDPDHCLKLKALNESKKSNTNVSEKFTISPHLKFEAGNRFMCLLCNIPVIRTDKNKSLYGHILGSMHQQNLRLHVSGQN